MKDEITCHHSAILEFLLASIAKYTLHWCIYFIFQVIRLSKVVIFQFMSGHPLRDRRALHQKSVIGSSIFAADALTTGPHVLPPLSLSLTFAIFCDVAKFALVVMAIKLNSCMCHAMLSGVCISLQACMHLSSSLYASLFKLVCISLQACMHLSSSLYASLFKLVCISLQACMHLSSSLYASLFKLVCISLQACMHLSSSFMHLSSSLYASLFKLVCISLQACFQSFFIHIQ